MDSSQENLKKEIKKVKMHNGLDNDSEKVATLYHAESMYL
jgi:hypothetical protein